MTLEGMLEERFDHPDIQTRDLLPDSLYCCFDHEVHRHYGAEALADISQKSLWKSFTDWVQSLEEDLGYSVCALRHLQQIWMEAIDRQHRSLKALKLPNEN